MGDDEPLVIRRLKNNMLAGLESRFPLTDVVVAATLLDCRFHGINEIEEFMKTKGTTKVSFLASMVRSRLMTEDIPQNKITDSAGEVGTSSSVNAANFLLDLARKHSATQQDAESAVENECWTYFATASPEHLQPYGGDVLQYWRDKKTCMPSLYALARSILNIPATSTPSERVFSTAGLVITAKRSRLNPIRVNRIVFIHDNYLKESKYSTVTALQSQLNSLRLQQQQLEDTCAREAELREVASNERKIRNEIAKIHREGSTQAWA
ncbi:hypothetical protein HF086_006077 [Spodoptera exigua]|uniref:HAT C-terminal dimerisation domain-containing protein n=1 Tax=Spodoptera exigua TaxID=7107 RepID=A0A922SL37_SPOEX|nr:hypothetical protein HF086_006077 [Spodoptera exigua]